MFDNLVQKYLRMEDIVITSLSKGEKRASELREQVVQELGRVSAPDFYNLMSGLETNGVVQGWYKPIVMDGHTLQERWYRYTGGGRRLSDVVENPDGNLDWGGLRLARV